MLDPTSSQLSGTPATNAQLLQQIERLKKALSAAEISRDQYAHIYRFAPIGYLTMNRDAQILGVNETAMRLLQETSHSLVGSHLARFVRPEDLSRYELLLEQDQAPGVSRSLDLLLERHDGSQFFAQMDCIRLATDFALSSVGITLMDITERKRSEAEISQAAFYDPLTGLANRRLLLDRLQHALLVSTRSMDHGALFFIDLDRFKALNDLYGHAVGDEMLRQVAKRLSECVRASDTVGRLSGDEFVVLVETLSKDPGAALQQARRLGQKLLSIFKQPFMLDGVSCSCAGSIGISLFLDHEDSVEELIKHADLALYRAKQAGRNRLRFFDPAMQESVTAQSVLDAELRRALADDEFVLHYQPQVDRSGRVTGAEALLRWQHPSRGLISPKEFLPCAEEKGLMGTIGEWVLRSACAQLQQWSSNPELAHLTLSINVSAHEFAHPDFVARSLALLDNSSMDPGKLTLELAETVMLNPLQDIVAKMRPLKARGVHFALEDFGVGYSSLVYLQSLPLDQIKIDRSFIRNLTTNPNDSAITRWVISLALGLGLQVIAEGVETVEQRDVLASQGCLRYQGFLYGGPQPEPGFATVGRMRAMARDR